MIEKVYENLYNGLFVMSDSHFNPFVLQLFGYVADVCLAIVIGEEHVRFDDFCGTNQLVGGHGVGLVAGQEGDVDVFDVGHFGNVFGVAGNIDAQAVDGQDVAIVASFGVEVTKM